jgi:hypothetical protein
LYCSFSRKRTKKRSPEAKRTHNSIVLFPEKEPKSVSPAGLKRIQDIIVLSGESKRNLSVVSLMRRVIQETAISLKNEDNSFVRSHHSNIGSNTFFFSRNERISSVQDRTAILY